MGILAQCLSHGHETPPSRHCESTGSDEKVNLDIWVKIGRPSWLGSRSSCKRHIYYHT
jgi:hypothetical protein